MQFQVVEDLTCSDGIIFLKHLQRKCKVNFATVDDPVCLIKSPNLNVRDNFFCRYKITDRRILPVLSSEDRGDVTVLDDFDNLDSTPKNKTCLLTFKSTTGKSKQKRKSNDGYETYGISPNKSVRLAFQDNKSSASKARRNLNESFKTESESPNNRVVEQILNGCILKGLSKKQDPGCESSNNVWTSTDDELGVTYLETRKAKKSQTPYQPKQEIIVIADSDDEEDERKKLQTRYRSKDEIVVVADSDNEEDTKKSLKLEQHVKRRCEWINPEINCENSALNSQYKFYR